MKLISCYIENFGKLQNFKYNFSTGLNNIKQENGWGKTTFATFIKAMFYGLPATTKKNLDNNERKKFMPWQGGNYGGNVEFEISGKMYRVERFFGKKNSEDTFKLIDLVTGKQSKDFTGNIGEEIFDLNEESFERSSFIPQKMLDASLNESISNKLNNLIQGTTEKYNYEEAQKVLDSKRSSLHNKHNSGKIQIIEDQVLKVLGNIEELKNKSLSIKELEKQILLHDNEIQKLQSEQNNIKSQITNYGKVQEKIAHQERYQAFSKQISLTEQAILSNQQILNGKDLSHAELETYISLHKSILQKEEELNIKNKNNYLKHRYNELNNYFGGSDKVPSNEEVTNVYNKIVQCNALELNSNQLSKNKISEQTTTSRSIMIFLWVLVIAAGGVAIFTFQSVWQVALVSFIIGILVFLIVGFLYLKNLIDVKTSNVGHINPEKSQAFSAELSKLKSQINSFVSKFENFNLSYQTAINNIIANLKDYENIKKELVLYEENNNELLKNINEGKQKVKNFLAQFAWNNESSPAECLSCLDKVLSDEIKLSEQLSNQKAELSQFVLEKNFNIDDQLIANVNINELQDMEKLIQTKIDYFRDLKTSAIANINKIQDELLQLNDLENKRENLRAEQEMLKGELNAVKNAMKYLEEANNSLTAQYLQPMKKSLTKYLKIISDQNFENLHLDTKFNISFDEFGSYKTVDYYSEGYKNMINLCMRLALIETLYNKEKPFIVLDDPFINLDENKISNAKEFLSILANDYQIIHFSCHESRC